MVKKVKKKRTSPKIAIRILSGIVFFVVVGILYVHQHFQIVNLGYEMNKKMQKEEELLKEREYLRQELYSLKSLSRIEKEALRLGIRYPQSWQIKIIKVKKNGT